MPGVADVADQELLAQFERQLEDKLIGLDLCKAACPNDRSVLLQRCCRCCCCSCCSCFCYFCCAVLLLSLTLIPPLRSHFFVGAKVKEATGSEMPLQKIHHILFATVPNAWFYRDGGSGKAPPESGSRVLPTKQETARLWADELARHGLEMSADQLCEFISAFDLLSPLEKLWWEGLHWASLGRERPQVARIVFWVRFCCLLHACSYDLF